MTFKDINITNGEVAMVNDVVAMAISRCLMQLMTNLIIGLVYTIFQRLIFS